MKKYSLICFIFLTGLFSSCNDWLDITPQSETKAEDMFSSYSGFRNTLNGCYIQMKDRRIYGERLTMSSVDVLAQLWNVGTSRTGDVALKNFDYTDESAEDVIKEMYGGLYSVIAQVNMILENKDRMDCIADPVARAVVLGEAYALRAYCHFDVLRLFGQLPQHPGRTVSLPYAERVSAVELPGYYDYAAFCKKIETDLAAAEEALQGVDPVIEQGMVYSGNNDSHLDYRGLYLNYYAIKALQARFWLYTGDSGKAYTAAKIVYDAKPVTLSGREDLGRYNACPSECLFMLSVNELLDYSINVLHGGADINLNDGHLSITNDMRNALYPSVHYNGNRNSSLWASNSGKFVLTKYYYNSSNTYDSEILLTKLQIIPMLRMSEIYLILLETTSDQAEADTLYEEYMRSHDISVSGIALADISAEVLNEMRREFIGEGQMFYTYKRTGATGMLWGSGVIGEDQYILPLPRTESDPDSSNSK